MKLALLTAAAILILGIFYLPIGYYSFLRITTTLAAIVVVVSDWKGKITPILILFALIAIILIQSYLFTCITNLRGRLSILL